MRNALAQLHSIDIPVALALAHEPGASYQALSGYLGISPSTAHGAVRRLQLAGLVRPGGRAANWLALREFLAHGLRYVFPARPGERVRGVPTAHAAPPLSDHIAAEDVIVWPASGGSASGQAIEPLFPQAVELPERQPAVYEMVALADALRIGRARERGRALEELESRVRRPAHAA